MAQFVLYQRDYCHLCDQALAVLAQARLPEFDSVWVDDSHELEDRYGTRVPVCATFAMVASWIGRSMKPPCAISSNTHESTNQRIILR